MVLKRRGFGNIVCWESRSETDTEQIFKSTQSHFSRVTLSCLACIEDLVITSRLNNINFKTVPV